MLRLGTALSVLVMLLGLNSLWAQKVDEDFEVNVDVLQQAREDASDYHLRRRAMVFTDEQKEELQGHVQNLWRLYYEEKYKEVFKRARKLYRHSIIGYSPAAPVILDIAIRARLSSGVVTNTEELLNFMWFRHTTYPDIKDLFIFVLDKADELQRKNTRIDLSAENPKDVLYSAWLGVRVYDANRLYAFLSDYGDFHTIAPRARLGLARSELILSEGHPKLLGDVRLKYEQLLEDFPRAPFVFDALLELALSYILGYGGDRFDGGVLEQAIVVLRIAEGYVNNDPERAQKITDYYNLIARWQQAKDLRVASWYHDKKKYDAAVFYYQQVIDLDANSNAAQEATRKRDQIVERLAQREQPQVAPVPVGGNVGPAFPEQNPAAPDNLVFPAAQQ